MGSVDAEGTAEGRPAPESEATESTPVAGPEGADAAQGPETDDGSASSAEAVAAKGTQDEDTGGDEGSGSSLRLSQAGEALAEVAAALVQEPVSLSPSPPGPLPEEPVTFAVACERLGVSPYVLRRLMDDYEDVLPPLVEAGTERQLPPDAVRMLATIARWRNDGVGREEIVRRLRAGEAEAAAGDGTDGPPVERLVNELGRLHDELRRNEERRAEDRDRLLTAMMRNSQELQQLRYELAVARSRKERRKGFWGRLFG